MSNEFKKIGTGHASAMGRQGLRELRGAMYPESNVAQQPEYGLYGTKTPGEVADSREVEPTKDEERPKSALNEKLRQAEQSRDLGEDPSKGRDRDD